MVLTAAGPVPCAAEPSARQVLQISSDTRIAVLNGREIELEVRAARQDDYASIARRTTGDVSSVVVGSVRCV